MGPRQAAVLASDLPEVYAIPLHTAPAPMGGAALSSPFPLFTPDYKLEFANMCLYCANKTNDGHRSRRAYRIGPGRSEGGRMLDFFVACVFGTTTGANALLLIAWSREALT